MYHNTTSSPAAPFRGVSASLADLIGSAGATAAAHARAALTGAEVAGLLHLAHDPVEFLPAAFLEQQHRLLPQVGATVLAAAFREALRGASPAGFDAATKRGQAPLSALGLFRVGEDGRLWLISKSEHYHVPLGHGFPGYALLDRARQLGIPNATHNNTRGRITRLLEEELVRTVNGLAPGDSAALERVLASHDPYVCNRVLNLETGSLAVEAALKMVLARFYSIEPGGSAPAYHGRTPVLLVVGNDEGGLQANYHGTTFLTQTMRGMWPEFGAGMESRGLFRVCPVRPNRIDDLEAAFARCDRGPTKIAAFFHEIVMMNYGGRLLTREFLQRAYALCRAHDVPTVCDEIQSCLWHPDLFMFREWGLTPTFVAVGKGLPGGEYPASRLVFSAALDCLPQFGALVTNGQEELASLAYLITMRWATANSEITRDIGDYYETRLRALASAHPGKITAVEGSRHMTTLCFSDLSVAKNFAGQLNQRGLDASVQVYKAECPPAVLTKIPLICTPAVVDFMAARMDEALQVGA